MEKPSADLLWVEERSTHSMDRNLYVVFYGYKTSQWYLMDSKKKSPHEPYI